MQRELRGIFQRHDAIDIAFLHHAGSVDAQDQLEQIAGIQILGIAVGIQNDRAFHGGIENVVDVKLAGELIDHLGERRVL